MSLPRLLSAIPVLACALALANACADNRSESTGGSWFPPPAGGDDGGSSGGDDGEATGEDDGNDDSGDGGDPLPDAGDDGGDTGDDGNDPGEPPEGGYPSELPLVLTGLEVPGDVDLGLATNPQTKRNPGGAPDDQKCFDLINVEREKAGLAPFKWDGDLVDLARSHSEDMLNLGYGGHGSSTNDQHLYQQRAEFLGLKDGKFRSVVETAGAGQRTPEAIVQGWMGSPGHREMLMGEGMWAANEYMACARAETMWNAEFGAP